MKFQVVVGFIMCTSTMSFACDTCTVEECFDCTECDKDCQDVAQPCDSDCLVKYRKFLCELENENCKEYSGCNIPPVDITVWPAANHNTTLPAWAPKTIPARPNCCYELEVPWDNTTSGITNNGQCVILYDNHGCVEGTANQQVQVDGTWSQACLDDFSCPAYSFFNDKASSFKLC